MSTTVIEWATHTLNLDVGCAKVSAGCKHCYAERMAARLAKIRTTAEIYGQVVADGRWSGRVVRLPERLSEIDKYPPGARVFVDSMSDFFNRDPILDFSLLAEPIIRMANRPDVTFMLLTKRPRVATSFIAAFQMLAGREPLGLGVLGWPENILVGMTIENERMLLERIWEIPNIRRSQLFCSYEPALGPIACNRLASFGWLIAGAESGPGARPAELGWFRDARDICREFGIPFFMKQLCSKGRKIPYEQWPEDLQIREFPETMQ